MVYNEDTITMHSRGVCAEQIFNLKGISLANKKKSQWDKKESELESIKKVDKIKNVSVLF
jgi:hypothetical protein